MYISSEFIMVSHTRASQDYNIMHMVIVLEGVLCQLLRQCSDGLTLAIHSHPCLSDLHEQFAI